MNRLNIFIDKLIWSFILVLFSSFYIFNSNTYSRFILLGITIIIFFLLIIRDGLNFHFYWQSFHTYVLLFALFCLISCFWSIDVSSSLRQSMIIFQLLICMSVLYIYFIQKETIIPMIDIIMWSGYIITIYSLFFYGIDNINYVVNNSARMDNSFSNVNSIGLLIAFSSIITVYKILFYKFKFYHFLLILNIIILAAAGSRTGLISFILGLFFVFTIKYSTKNFIMNLIRYILIFSVLFFIFKLILELQIFTNLNNRMETFFNVFTGKGNVDNSSFLRQWMIRIGWQSFLEHPFLGLGIGSSGEILASTIGWRTYMHNNYIELLSSIGIIGTALYYSMLLIPALQLYKYRASYISNTMFCLILIIVLMIVDISGTNYASKWTYFYVLLFFIQVQKNIKKSHQ